MKKNTLGKVRGFTLAETLITLGIIGIVAALTMPTLISDYRKKVYIAQLQKVYNQIYNAGSQLMADEDVDNINDTYLYISNATGEEGFDVSTQLDGLIGNSAGRFLKKYFKVTKDCGVTNRLNCLAANYTDLNGNKGLVFESNVGSYCVGVNTGSTICMYPPDISSPAQFFVDINGPAGPNIAGRDAFMFDMNYNGDVSESVNGSIANQCGVSNVNYAAGCFDKIIQDGWRMDY